jgi:hypothetical protein
MSGIPGGPSGVVAIWNGIADEARDEFYRWHETEHMPERLAIPGFLRGRRYRAADGGLAFFTRYDVENPAILTSDAYLARLNAPTEWTRRMLPHFRDTSRALCTSLLATAKHSRPWLGTLKLFGNGSPDDRAQALRTALASLEAGASVHLLATNQDASAVVTSERASRRSDSPAPDRILLVEALDRDAVQRSANQLAVSMSVSEADIGVFCLEYDLLGL